MLEIKRGKDLGRLDELSMSAGIYAAFGAGAFFMAVVVVIGCFIAFRPDNRPIPDQAMWIFRVVLALAGAAFAVILTGFLDIAGQIAGWTVRSGGGLAVFVTLYLLNPPNFIKSKTNKRRKPVVISVPPDRIGPEPKERN